MNRSMVEAVFKVNARLSFGEELYISGNVPMLGCDSIERAVALVTTQEEYPWWTTKEAFYLPGDEGTVTYRYAIFVNGKFSRWERNGELRVFKPPRNKTQLYIVEDKFDVIEDVELSAPKSPGKVVNSTHGHSSLRRRVFSSWSSHSALNTQELSQTDSVIIVSYFLPVVLSKRPGGGWQAAWDVENLLSLQLDSTRTVWVGSVRYGSAPIPVEEEEAVASVLAAMNCFPVFINQNMHHQFYDIYCKQNLWMVMHHIADVYGPLNQSDKSVKTQQTLWYNYSTVHKLFREKVTEVFQAGSMIWIQGFHLLLLPSFLRRFIPQAKIGYFFHTPFPSSEIWRTMARREDLLRGILGADQIGFHLYEYARHFLTTCHRLLGYNSEVNSAGRMIVNVDGREVAITCIHVGVDLPRLNDMFAAESFKRELLSLKNVFRGKVVISGIDRLERLKGIPLKLMAIDDFLDENPQWVNKVVFPFIGITANERGQDYRQTLHDVQILVKTINEKHEAKARGPVIIFQEKTDREIRLAQRLAYFAASDVLLMTATRDGLNRYPMEFTLARNMHGKLVESGEIVHERLPGAGLPHQGLVIIGEFISSARVMRGGLIVNPWRVDEVTQIIKHALEMTDSERADRSRRNLEFSTRLTTANWAKHVLSDLRSVERSEDPNANYAVGFGLQYKVMNLKAGFHALDIQDTCKAYRNARHRLILLDWGGTLVPNVDKHDKLQAYAMATGAAHREGVSDELRMILEILCSDSKNVIFVISGKEVRTVSDYFGGIKGLGLAAEHGFYYHWPHPEVAANSSDNKAKWQTIMETTDDSWKASTKLVMDIFVQRTHGTYIEQKGNALIWQYSDADPEFGFMQSKELEEHLSLILSQQPVEVIRGGGVADGYIEVRPTGASKGLFLDHALTTMKANRYEADFILAVGDDNSDEPMFHRIVALQQEQQKNQNAYAVTVGKKPTAAKCYLDDPSAVLELLNSLSKVTQRDRQYSSVIDLPSQASAGYTFNRGISPMRHVVQNQAKSVGLQKATSTGQLPVFESESHSALTAAQQQQTAAMGGKSVEDYHSPPTSMKSFPSASQLTMTEFLNSITEDNAEDDDGIFF
jgi:trehalose 6-phosphate synthase/phosphatase